MPTALRTSLGQLHFDAAAAVLGLDAERVSDEGQAAVALEGLAASEHGDGSATSVN